MANEFYKKTASKIPKGGAVILFAAALAFVAISNLSLSARYEDLKRKAFEKEKAMEETNKNLMAQQARIGEVVKEIADIRNQFSSQIKTTQEKADKIKISLDEKTKNLENKITENENRIQAKGETSEKKISDLESKLSRMPNELVSVIKEWRPKVAKITCEWRSRSGSRYLSSGGSGFIFSELSSSGSRTWALTNKHVFIIDGNAPSVCSVKLPDDSSVYTMEFSEDTFRTFSDLDIGLIEIKNPNNYAKQIASTKAEPFCRYTASIGEKMAILGYPGIGNQNDITATEGIISGYDGDYYITSAKIEMGNSGGIAVSTENNCILGIPTFVKAGKLETLGRILINKKMFEAWGIPF